MTNPLDYAFPVAPGDVPYWQPGMTLRDHFAAIALQSIGDWTPWPSGEVSVSQDDPRIDLRAEEALTARAEWAYRQADAMLKVRANSDDDPAGANL